MNLFALYTYSKKDSEIREYYIITKETTPSIESINKCKSKEEEVYCESQRKLIYKENKNCLFNTVIADVYGVGDDYNIFVKANTIEEAIATVKEKLSMAERLVVIEEVRKFYEEER